MARGTAKTAGKKTSKIVVKEITKEMAPTPVVQPAAVSRPAERVPNTAPYSLQAMLRFLNNNAGLLFLGLAVFIVGFLIGSMWTENKLLKAGAPTAAAQPAGAAAPGAAAPAPTTATVSFGKLPFKGDKNAQIGIVEFADFRCPFCKQFFTTAEAQLMKDYVNTGKAKFAFRHYEFLGPASVTAGNAAECANEQGKFWEYYDYLYANQPSESDTSMFTSEKLTSIATGLGINGPQFKSCLDSTKYTSNLTTDMTEGSAAGISGTPSFVIGKINGDGKVEGQLLVGAQDYTAFKAVLDNIK